MRLPTRFRAAISCDLRDELGDLLLQVVFHARDGRGARAFDFGAVVEAITQKMIRRHPHVFGDESARGAGMAKGMWEKIKSGEKAAGARAARRRPRPRGPRQGLFSTACRSPCPR